MIEKVIVLAACPVHDVTRPRNLDGNGNRVLDILQPISASCPPRASMMCSWLSPKPVSVSQSANAATAVPSRSVTIRRLPGANLGLIRANGCA